MSILIKGMDMPISCEKCPLCYDYLNCSIDDSLQMYLYNRHPNCPLIEIPTPHGRLIDIDKVKDKLRDQIPCCGLDMTYSNSNAFDTMDNAPTILEAEE